MKSSIILTTFNRKQHTFHGLSIFRYLIIAARCGSADIREARFAVSSDSIPFLHPIPSFARPENAADRSADR